MRSSFFGQKAIQNNIARIVEISHFTLHQITITKTKRIEHRSSRFRWARSSLCVRYHTIYSEVFDSTEFAPKERLCIF